MRLAKSKVHFIGIGGIGMCGLAELLHNMGAPVSGSDQSENAQTLRLKEMGVRVIKGHAPENIGDAEVVVYSSAVKADNPEYREALKRKIPLIRRAEALAEIMRLKRGIAVAGTHGKTTTTSLTASVFLSAGSDPTIVVGGRLDVIKSTAQLGQGEWLIAEADESDGSFTRLSPEIVIITNIDTDHLDHYKSFENLKEAFHDFASRIPFYGVAIVCGDDPHIREVFSHFGKRWISYGLKPDNDYVLKKGAGANWSVEHAHEVIGVLNVPMPGEHNALNALAATLTGLQAGLTFEQAARGIAEFRGVDRRFQHKASVRGIDVYDDYGHHPTEIKAVLRGMKERFPERRIVTVFQPHRYSRTKICWNEFLTCFSKTDVLFLVDIYAAGEAPLEGVTSERLVQEIQHANAHSISRQKDPQLSQVREFLKPGDVLLTLGAGDISKLGEQMLETLAKGS